MDVRAGEITSIMGASGCGKSTLLSWIVGSLDPVFSITGDVVLDGVNLVGLASHTRRVGILFQDDLLFPHMTVQQNLQFALPSEVSRKEQRIAIDEALHSVELPHLATHKTYQLSGGQRVRISLMRMLMSKPKAILLDEPFSKLDSNLKQRMRDMVFSHIRRVNVPALMVTHDIEDARSTQGAIIKFTDTISTHTQLHLSDNTTQLPTGSTIT